MTNVILNRHGVDHVSLSLSTTGSSTASTTLDNLLLDPALDYIARVTELNAPMQGVPIFGFNNDGTPINQELFSFKQRTRNTTLAAFNAGFETGVSLDTVGLNDIPYKTTASFITSLAKVGHQLNEYLDGFTLSALPVNNPVNVAIPAGSGYEYMRIRLNSDGVVEFQGGSGFWNHLAIQFSAYGVVLFGMQDFVDENNILALTIGNANQAVYELFVNGAVIDHNNAAYNTVQNTTTIRGKYPLFKNLDHRYFVSVTTDLLTEGNVKVVDGKQMTEHAISKSFFPTECTVILESEAGITREDVDFQIETYVGQHAYIKKTAPSQQWTFLRTSFDLRFFRFHLYITYRRFENGVFKLTRYRYPVGDTDSWDLSMEFVSKI